MSQVILTGSFPELKAHLGFNSLGLNTSESDPNWMSAFRNEDRVSVSIHKDTIKEIQNDPEYQMYGLQKEMRTSQKGLDYTSYRIVKLQEPELTL